MLVTRKHLFKYFPEIEAKLEEMFSRDYLMHIQLSILYYIY